MSIKIQTAPAAEPIELEEAKLHLRVDIDDDDVLIEAALIAIREACEGYKNHRFITQTWDIFMDAFPGSDEIILPDSLFPLVSVTHIKYTDEDNNQSTFDSGNYATDVYSNPARIKLTKDANWPSDPLYVINGVEIQVIVGYGDPDDVPKKIKQAMLLWLGHYYENREQVTVGEIAREIPLGVETLLWFDRNIPV